MKKIITFGSATWDIYIDPKQKIILPHKECISKKVLAFNLGSKINLKTTDFSIGGGGINAAVTFKRQGLDVSYMGCVGEDVLGSQIINKLKKIGIKTRLIQRTDKMGTNCSIIFNNKALDRTIMVYRGASECLSFKKTKADWFYLAPLSGKSAKQTEEIVDYAKKNNIKVAFNPGNSQLTLSKKKILNILSYVDVLILNNEEASVLTKTEYTKEKEIIKEIQKIFNGIAVITKGKKGVTVITENKIYKEKALKVKTIDQTGAGDAFGSAFISSLIKDNDIQKAIKLGIKNSSSCVRKQGSINGLI
jgi:sugar/nucleoside kinase (ribokinase family)